MNDQRWSLGAGATHDELKQSFDEHGFVAIRQFITGASLTQVIDNVQRVIANVVPQLPTEHVFYETKGDPSTLKQIQHVGDHDPWFGEFYQTGRLREIAEVLLDGRVVPKNLQYFNKPPAVGQPTPAHQDGYYFMLDPCHALTMWLALDEVDQQNGCVRYVERSHLGGMREHARTSTLGFSQGIVDYPNERDLRREVAIAAHPGDLLIHHAMTVHRAGGNDSADRARRALGFIYFSASARQDQQAQAAYQRQLARDLKASGKI